jgi:hypothetical protein
MDKPTTEPAKVGNVDVETLSRNVARLIEEGGKALAAYLKPREEGKVKGDSAEDITDVVKSVGRVAEYWMSASKPNRLPHPILGTNGSPIPNGRRINSSIF